MNARSQFDRIVQRQADGFSQDFWLSDSESGRREIAALEQQRETGQDVVLATVAEVLADYEVQYDKRFKALEARISELGGRAMGAYDPAAAYRALDRVSADGSEWIARRDDPGPLPGDGWMLGARAGGKGRPGERGPAGVGMVDVKGEGTSLVFSLNDKRIVVDIQPLVAAVLRKAKEPA